MKIILILLLFGCSMHCFGQLELGGFAAESLDFFRYRAPVGTTITGRDTFWPQRSDATGEKVYAVGQRVPHLHYGISARHLMYERWTARYMIQLDKYDYRLQLRTENADTAFRLNVKDKLTTLRLNWVAECKFKYKGRFKTLLGASIGIPVDYSREGMWYRTVKATDTDYNDSIRTTSTAGKSDLGLLLGCTYYLVDEKWLKVHADLMFKMGVGYHRNLDSDMRIYSKMNTLQMTVGALMPLGWWKKSYRTREW